MIITRAPPLRYVCLCMLTAKLMNAVKVYPGCKGTKQKMEITLILIPAGNHSDHAWVVVIQQPYDSHVHD